MSRLKLKYETEVKQSLIQKFAYKNVMQSPRLKKLVISMGLAEASKDKNAFQSHLTELAMLSGQKPLVTKARVSVAGFKLRRRK